MTQSDQNQGQFEGLLPCPFCGPGESIVSLWHDDVAKRWAVGCGRCGASSGRSVHREGSKEAAIKAWNTRAAAKAEISQFEGATPRPWRVEAGSRGAFYIVGHDDLGICTTYEPNQSMARMRGAPDSKANAALIVAAVNAFSGREEGWPTDAQINAAAEVMWNDRDARIGGYWSGRDPNDVCVIQTKATAKAALIAARFPAPPASGEAE